MSKYRIVVEFREYKEVEVEADSPEAAEDAYENDEGVWIDTGYLHCDWRDGEIVEIREVED